jgi:hypothetical protein
MGSGKDATSGMKSAYEAALERLEGRGIGRPREEALSPELRERVAEVRRRAEAQLAEIEILHRDRRQKARDLATVQREEEEYGVDRRRIEERRDAEIERLRSGD